MTRIKSFTLISLNSKGEEDLTMKATLRKPLELPEKDVKEWAKKRLGKHIFSKDKDTILKLGSNKNNEFLIKASEWT